jgi:hypothetical protein
MIERIQFYTAGCPRSQISEKNLKKALGELGLDIEIESIDDPQLHERDGVSAFPAIRINGEVKSEGEFLSVGACKEILTPYVDK